MLFIWLVIFFVSLVALVKGADLLLRKSERIGLAIGISPFVVGVVIVGVGTSFPELVSSAVAVWQGVTTIATANVIGSNIANILLIVGISALLGRKLLVTKNLIDLDLPLLAISTVLMFGTLYDREVTFFESLILVVAFILYLLYSILHKADEETDSDKIEALAALPLLPSRKERRQHLTDTKPRPIISRPKVSILDWFLLLVGIALLSAGAKYMIDAVIFLSEYFNINPGLISITAVAVGTSLPELIVSAKAALAKQAEVALGNIFGSNIFNGLLILGSVGLFRPLALDEATFTIGLPTMMFATLLFIISGISRRIWFWEGAMYLVVYVLFLGKLFRLF